MSYALRNDGKGWRAVSGPEDVGPDETYSPQQPELQPTLAEARAVALVAIDVESGNARARYITVAPGQEATYMLKEAQARRYKAAAYPSAAVVDYPMVDAESKAINGGAPNAAQIQSAADGIIAQADAWIAKAAQIERARIAGKRAVTAAVDAAGVDVAHEAAIAELMLL